MTLKLIAYDYETSSANPRECEPVQLAAVEVTIQPDGSYRVLSEFETLLKPENDIPAGAIAVHGITTSQAQLEGACPHQETAAALYGTVLGYNNVRFDDVIAKRYGAKIERSIDLFVGVSRLKTSGVIQKATLGAVYEHFTGKSLEGAHDALADVYGTLALIPHLMEAFGHETAEQLFEDLATFKVDLASYVMPFGKHKGTLVRDLPKSYLRWAKENMDVHGELRAALELVW